MTPPNMAGLTATSPAFAEYARLSSAEALKAALQSLDLDPSTPGAVIALAARGADHWGRNRCRCPQQARDDGPNARAWRR